MKAWPLNAAIALTLLFAAISAGLMFYPVEVTSPTNGVVVAQTPERRLDLAVADGVPTEVSEAFTWGLGAGVTLTCIFLLSPFPRLRYK